MDAEAAQNAVKKRLDIAESNTDFDSQIDEFVLSAAKRLYPIAQLEVAIQTKTVTVDEYGETSVDLSALTTPCLAARKVEYSTGEGFFGATETFHHGVHLIVRELPSSVSSLKIYGVTEFELETVPSYLELAVIWYAISEFYDLLARSKSKYNVYMDNGARSVDNMRDEADYYEQKANAYLNDRTTLYGVA